MRIAPVLLLVALQAGAQLPLQQDRSLFMPGSQPGSAKVRTATTCFGCHGDYDATIEPVFHWRGSMMGQAGRDPLWMAAMTVAEQDSLWLSGNPNVGSLCLRCHAPAAWLAGRAEPVNLTRMSAEEDHQGVSCDFCHRMVDPMHALRQPDVPADPPGSKAAVEAQRTFDADTTILSALKLFDGSAFLHAPSGLPRYYGATVTAYSEATSGQYVVHDLTDDKRGPRSDAISMHKWSTSRFHRSPAFCGTCHDVSNAAIANNLEGVGTSEQRAAASYGHLERTYSEFVSSGLAREGKRCQDCHMPAVNGASTMMPGVPSRADMARHDLTGGNAWITAILASVDRTSKQFDAYNYAILSGQKYAGAKIDVAGLQEAGAALEAGRRRAIGELQKAAALRIVSASATEVTLRIENRCGHKLISGFPEGRRLWLNVIFVDGGGSVVGEINPYEPLVTRRDAAGNEQYVSGGVLTMTRDDLVYEAKMSSALSGESDSFHFALITGRTKDNRIPPAGFSTAAASERLALPVANGSNEAALFTSDEYAGGYDQVTFAIPAGAPKWRATLYYQTTSKEYVEFLRDEINGTATSLTAPTRAGRAAAYVVQSDPFFAPLRDWGRAIWDLWLHNNGAAPVPMATIPPEVGRRRSVRR